MFKILLIALHSLWSVVTIINKFYVLHIHPKVPIIHKIKIYITISQYTPVINYKIAPAIYLTQRYYKVVIGNSHQH